MNRAEKVAFVENLAEGVKTAQALAVMSFEKLSVEKMTNLRLNLRKKGVYVRVVKNTLAKRVFDQTEFKALSEKFVGPTLVAYSEQDPVLTAKAIWEWASKEDYNVKVKIGAALGQVMDTKQMESLSKLPGKNELYVSFLWALKSGPTKFLYALQDAPRRLGYALEALRAQKESKEGN